MSDENKLKLKYDEASKNKEDINSDNDSSITMHSPTAHVRNICFIQKDGKRLFLSYAYLISVEFLPEENTIILTFTTHTATLKGYLLETLYEALENHGPKRVREQDERYLATNQVSQPVVAEISIEIKP